MPLVIIAGLPSTGKSTRANQIKEFLQDVNKVKVHIVSENDIINNKELQKNKVFSDPQKEKEIRGILKSEAIRLLTPENVVILDAGNYIKGYRYELYCASKNSGSTQVTVETICAKEEAWDWNIRRSEEERYSKECYDALHLRYEIPDSRNRWDSPLFCLQSHESLPGNEIYQALFLRKPPPPNQSTQSAPLSSANFLNELDKITQAIVAEIISAKKCGAEGTIKLPCHGGIVLQNISGSCSPAQLARYRRQFLNYAKLHPPSPKETPDGLAQLFGQFLNTTLSALPS